MSKNLKILITSFTMLVYFSTISFADEIRNGELVPDENISFYNDRWHIGICGDIGFPQPKLGLSLEKKCI